uniref:LPXTG cell wall anchor domain-containing protein n=1 Tax=Streptomyces shenzhenensis TaxID=943815 RepID=UPI001F2FB311
DESSPAADGSSPAAADSSPADSGSPTPSTTPSKPSDWTPDQCDAFSLDENLKVAVDGLPSKIVAGSGWRDFTFSVQNNSDTDLKNVWVDTFTEYDDNVNGSLAYELAQLQYKDPQTGKWTDSYQDSDGSDVVPCTFVGVIDAIDKGAKVDMDLRVRVSSKAPAGSSFAMSSAIYAGKGASCNGNGDSYEFTVLKAGSTTPAGTGDAKPTGDKPTGKPQSDMKPQGGSEQLPVTGSLAQTGSSSALPAIGLIGAAVAAGVGAMFVVRRRRGAGANPAA